MVAMAAVVLLTAGCLGGSEGGGGGGGAKGGTESGDKKVELMTGFGGEQLRALQAETAAIGKELGITINVVPSTDFNTLIRSRVAGNNTPDIAGFPQPGLLLDIAKQGKLADLGSVLNMDTIKANLVPGELEAATADDGKVYGVPFSMNVKSIVFYDKPNFEKAGYTIPQTNDELLALTDKIRSEGKTPWCIGIGAGPATGWPATDWIESYVLYFGGPEKYDQWIKHEIPFNDPVVKQAAEQFAKIAFTPGNVPGGRKAIVSTTFETAANPMFKNPPGCYLHRQGNFITQKGFFPEGVRAKMDEEVGVFPLPPVKAGPAPVLGGGDLLGLFNSEDDDAKKVMEAMTNEKFGTRTDYAQTGEWISPFKNFDVSLYPNKVLNAIARYAYGASVFRFDGSDAMPGAVGTGSFWKEMVAWVGGTEDLDTALKNIDDSWPKS
jgi:ABC-type glycerol-3-phosphate transport system substrate-binding protein